MYIPIEEYKGKKRIKVLLELAKQLNLDNHRHRIEYRMLTTQILKYYKQENKLRYVDISRIFRVHEKEYSNVTILSRYINGHVLPNLERAKKIIQIIETEVYKLE